MLLTSKKQDPPHLQLLAAYWEILMLEANLQYQHEKGKRRGEDELQLQNANISAQR